MKAFRVIAKGFDINGIVFAEKRSSAMWAGVSSYCDAFNVSPKEAFRVIKIKRANEYDHMKHKANFVYGEDYINET